MNHYKIARPYAKAFFELACETNQLEKLKTDLELVDTLCKTEPQFNEMLQSPVMKIKLKIDAFQHILGGKISAPTMQLLCTMAENKREVCLPEVCFKFRELYRQKMGIKQAKVTTAIPLTSELQAKVAASISKNFNAKIELTTEIDPEIIGGFVIRVDDQQIDASIANKLNRIKQAFLNTSV